MSFYFDHPSHSGLHLPKWYPFFVFLVLFVPLAFGQENVPYTPTLPGIDNPAFPYAKPESVGVSSEKLQWISDDIKLWVANGDLVGGELLIIKEGKTILHEAYGWAHRESRRPAERNSIWSIKSMSKPFTTTALMMLVEEGKLSLDDKLLDYIPEYVGNPNTTIAHLVSHMSGYRKYDYHDPDWTHKSLKDWVLDWARTKPTGTFGNYEYTDFGFAAAGYLVELVSGMSIEEFTQQRILEPLNLTDTSTGFSDDPEWRDRLNAWYRWDSELKRFNLRWETSRGPWGIYPAAWGMFSTAMEYAKFLNLFLHDGTLNGVKLLEASTVKDMVQPHGFFNDSPRYGYGWFVYPSDAGDGIPYLFGHDGGDGTSGYAYPRDAMIVVFMTHSRDGGHLNNLLDRINQIGLSSMPLGRGMVPIADFKKPFYGTESLSLEDYTGHYRGKIPEDPKEEFLIRVEKVKDHLIIRFNSFGQETGIVRDLVYLGENRFAPGVYEGENPTWANPGVDLVFHREGGVIRSLDMILDGNNNVTGVRMGEEEIAKELGNRRNRTYVDDLIDATLQEKGMGHATSLSKEMHRNRPDTLVFHERLLNELGYRYLSKERFEEAIAIFRMNIEAYPNSPNCYDSMADAWRSKGDLEKALYYYQEAVTVAKRENDPRLENIENRLKKIQEMIDSKK